MKSAMDDAGGQQTLDALHSKLAEAEEIARRAHGSRQDRVGAPYFLHVRAVSQYAGIIARNRREPEAFVIKAQIVGFLHDVIEDTDMTAADLETQGLPDDCLQAIRLLTHDDGRPYLQYVMDTKQDALARTVKLADLVHNSDLSRYIRAGREITPADLQRMDKYRNGIECLIG